MVDAGWSMLDGRCWVVDAGWSMLVGRCWVVDAGWSMLDDRYRIVDVVEDKNTRSCCIYCCFLTGSEPVASGEAGGEKRSIRTRAEGRGEAGRGVVAARCAAALAAKAAIISGPDMATTSTRGGGGGRGAGGSGAGGGG